MTPPPFFERRGFDNGIGTYGIIEAGKVKSNLTLKN